MVRQEGFEPSPLSGTVFETVAYDRFRHCRIFIYLFFYTKISTPEKIILEQPFPPPFIFNCRYQLVIIIKASGNIPQSLFPCFFQFDFLVLVHNLIFGVVCYQFIDSCLYIPAKNHIFIHKIFSNFFNRVSGVKK